MSVITLQDVNSCFMRHPSSWGHVLDTSNIGEFEFSNVKLDFAIVSHSINGDDHTFTFEIINDNWKGVYYITDINGNDIIFENPPIVRNNIISVTCRFTAVKLYLYCTVLNVPFNLYYTNKITDLFDIFLTVDELNQTYSIPWHPFSLDAPDTIDVTISNFGVLQIVNSIPIYLYIHLKKTDFICNPENILTVGKINKVPLNTDSRYLPNGSRVLDENMDLTIRYNDKEIPVYYDESLNDYCFDVDLTKVNTLGNVSFELVIGENTYVKQNIFQFKLSTKYTEVSNFTELINEVTLYGNEIIELNNNITCYSRINVDHDLVIYGNDYNLDLNGFGFNIQKDCVFKLNNINCSNGDSCIIQSINTKIDLTNCTFSNCESSNYNNLGSVLYCDVNLESLSDVDDFITIISKCTFIDNHNCIFHGGDLTISECKLHNTNTSYMDNNNTAFVYQTDGRCEITDSIFDITYSSNELCDNEINIGYAQTLIMCGKTAIINNASSNLLNNDNSLPFFESPYDNTSHIFVKYYYPQIEDNIVSSPEQGQEDKCLCYSVAGDDWIYKTNVTVTRLIDGNYNNYNPINWE